MPIFKIKKVTIIYSGFCFLNRLLAGGSIFTKCGGSGNWTRTPLQGLDWESNMSTNFIMPPFCLLPPVSRRFNYIFLYWALNTQLLKPGYLPLGFFIVLLIVSTTVSRFLFLASLTSVNLPVTASLPILNLMNTTSNSSSSSQRSIQKYIIIYFLK